MVFLIRTYKKRRRIPDRQYWFGEQPLQLSQFWEYFACAILQERIKNEGGSGGQPPQNPLSSKTIKCLKM